MYCTVTTKCRCHCGSLIVYDIDSLSYCSPVFSCFFCNFYFQISRLLTLQSDVAASSRAENDISGIDATDSTTDSSSKKKKKHRTKDSVLQFLPQIVIINNRVQTAKRPLSATVNFEFFWKAYFVLKSILLDCVLTLNFDLDLWKVNSTCKANFTKVRLLLDTMLTN